MTAPTPEEWTDGIDFLKRLVISDSHRSDRAQALLDGIAAVTAERDQAVAIVHDCERDMKALRGRVHELTTDRVDALENARASQQMHENARQLLDLVIEQRDELARQLGIEPEWTEKDA